MAVTARSMAVTARIIVLTENTVVTWNIKKLSTFYEWKIFRIIFTEFQTYFLMEKTNLNIFFKIGFNIILLYNLQGYFSNVGSTDILNELKLDHSHHPWAENLHYDSGSDFVIWVDIRYFSFLPSTNSADSPK